MKVVSPHRRFSATIAALISAALLLPTGVALANAQVDSTDVESTQAATATPAPQPEQQPSQVSVPEPQQTSDLAELNREPAPVVDSVSDDATPHISATPEIEPLDVDLSDSDESVEETTTADDVLDFITDEVGALQGDIPQQCTDGHFFSLTPEGRIDYISPPYQGDAGSGRDELGYLGAEQSGDWEALGVNGTNSMIYAVNRTTQKIRGTNTTVSVDVVRWDLSSSAPEVVAETVLIDLDGEIIAGGVDLSTGAYYFAGVEFYGSGGDTSPRLKIWRYTDAGGVAYVGNVDLNLPSSTISSISNGDIAFNSDGDLYFLLSSNVSAIGTITAADLAAGGDLNFSLAPVMSLGQGGGNNATGIAFSSDGTVYLGRANNLYHYNPSTWIEIASYENALRTGGEHGSVDLAGCSSYPSLEIIKNVEERVDSSDQFDLVLEGLNASGEQMVLGTATTQGSETGVQAQQLGPVPLRTGVSFTVSEHMAEGAASALDAYATSYVCTTDNGQHTVASGAVTEFDITLEQQGKKVTCEFTNAPLPDTALTLTKELDTSFGALGNSDDWTLTATREGETAYEFESGQTHAVDAGDYTLGEFFGEGELAEDVGYELSNITCLTDGVEQPVVDGVVTLESHTVTACELTNTALPGAVTWEKTDSSGQHLVGSTWILTGPEGFGELHVTDNGEHDTDKRDGYFAVDHLWWGSYELAESEAPDGYELRDTTETFDITGRHREYAFSEAFVNIAMPTLTLLKAFHLSYGAPAVPTDWNLVATRAETALTFEHDVTQNVDAGEYTLSETHGLEERLAGDVGYELEHIECSVDDGDAFRLGDDATVTIEPDTATTCTLVNIDLPGTVIWHKTNPDNVPLSDSAWLLTGPEGFGEDGELAVIDNGEFDADDADGTIRVTGLHWGEYGLEETKAPAGFQLISGTHNFAVTGIDREFTFAENFVNEPLQPGELPLTGVFTGKWPLIGAVTLAFLVLAGLAWSLRKGQTT